MNREKRANVMALVCLKSEDAVRNKKDRMKIWEQHVFNSKIQVYFVLKHTYAQVNSFLLYSVAFVSLAVIFTVNIPEIGNFPLLLSSCLTFHPWGALCVINNLDLAASIWNQLNRKMLSQTRGKPGFVFIYGKHRKMMNKYL